MGGGTDALRSCALSNSHASRNLIRMNTRKSLSLCGAAVIAFGCSSSAKAEIKESAVEYKAGGVLCEGWHAYDSAKEGKRPAVLVIHQWTGLSDYEKMRAGML